MAEEKPKEEPTLTPEQQLEELRAKLNEAASAHEAQQAELERIRKDKDALLKDLKKIKDEREALRAAQMTEEERIKAEAARAAELEARLAKTEADALRYRILSTTNHGLDPVFARLVEGTDEASIMASIEALKAEQAEFAKRLVPPGGKGTGPEPPANAGGPKPLMLSEDDIRKMTPAQFAELERKIASGEVEVP